MKKYLSIFSLIILGLTLSGCNFTGFIPEKGENTNLDNNQIQDLDNIPNELINDSSLIVKSSLIELKGNIDFKKYHIISSHKLFQQDNFYWHQINLDSDIKSIDAIAYIKTNKYILDAELDCTYSTQDVTNSDPKYNSANQYYMDNINVSKTWKYMEDNNGTSGGNNDVIVAVIDTGVDLDHEDLKNNIWINKKEIADNNIDDDGNGYIDDVYGINCVEDNNNPNDDNGHGTHVAGIIAAENNGKGVTGIAYNCKIMAIKAGNASGNFLNSDIAEAINYAYKNGADIINMSFGGHTQSTAILEALKIAYTTSVLISAAGNDACQNQEFYSSNISKVNPSYPAAYPFVIGVMSNNKYNKESAFTNYDVYRFNDVEYEVYAPGEDIYSTFLDNSYEYLSGTSMAAPVVSGIAALLRSQYSNTNAFSTKYIQAQIVNSCEKLPSITLPGGGQLHTNSAKIVDAYLAMSKAPIPDLSFFNMKILETKNVSDLNNEDEVIDAGEIIKIGFYLNNRGGVAKDVKLTLKPLSDPFIEVLQAETTYSNVGTYSIHDPGEIKDASNNVIDYSSALKIKILSNCPNDYQISLYATVSYKNGLDENDNNVYSYTNKEPYFLLVSSGVLLPEVIGENVDLSKDKEYFISTSCTIEFGVTVNVDAGTKVSFFTARKDSFYERQMPSLNIFGTLNVNGEFNNNVFFDTSTLYEHYAYNITINNTGVFNGKFMQLNNAFIRDYGKTVFYDSSFVYNPFLNPDGGSYYQQINGEDIIPTLEGSNFYDCAIISPNHRLVLAGNSFNGCLFNISGDINFQGSFLNCIVKNDSNNALIFGIMWSVVDNPIQNLTVMYNENQIIDSNKTIKIYIDTFTDLIVKNLNFVGLPEELIPSVLIDSNSNETMLDGNVTYEDFNVADNSNLLPYITSMKLYNEKLENIEIISGGNVTFEFVLSKPMNVDSQLDIYFGTSFPYNQHKVNGNYIDSTHWEGSYNFDDITGAGYIRFRFENGLSQDKNKNIVDNGRAFSATLDIHESYSNNLSLYNISSHVSLTWERASNSTLMGYNVYRSEYENGHFVKINTAIINKGTLTYQDDSILPGQSYYYMVTGVLSDFSEIVISDKGFIATKDTIEPYINHTPIDQAYTDSALLITCKASDNIGVKDVTLLYRNKDETTYHKQNMAEINGVYQTRIVSSLLSIEGFEYYISVSDGITSVTKGSADSPYFVIIKDASRSNFKGDVNGDGTISIQDAHLMMKHINGELILRKDQFQRADLNLDNELTSDEVLRLLRYINGSSVTL